MGSIKSFKELNIWQKGIDLVKDVCALTEHFPRHELFGLTSQMRRAVISIPSNVAEGFKRGHNKEYAQFLHLALGSAAELETQSIIARELGYVSGKKELYDSIFEKLDHVSRMISSLLTKLK